MEQSLYWSISDDDGKSWGAVQVPDSPPDSIFPDHDIQHARPVVSLSYEAAALQIHANGTLRVIV